MFMSAVIKWLTVDNRMTEGCWVFLSKHFLIIISTKIIRIMIITKTIAQATTAVIGRGFEESESIQGICT